MSYIIFIVSVIGIWCISSAYCRRWHTRYISDFLPRQASFPMGINISKRHYEEKKEIIDRIMCGNYENILDIVDNMRIN